MSGTTGPEHDPGIDQAILDYAWAVVNQQEVVSQQEIAKARAALYAAIADWHRRELTEPRGPAVYLDMGTAED